MKIFTTTAIAGALGLGLLSPPLLANPSQAALVQLIEQQSAQIEALQQRLSALESGRSDTDGNAEIEALYDQIESLQLQMAQVGSGGGAGSGNGLTSWRRGGPEFRTADGFYRMQLRGRVMFDLSSTGGSNFDERNISGTELRAVRLGAQGQIGAMRYKVDADFANQAVSVKDAWINWGWRGFGLPMEIFLGNRLKDRSIDGSNTLARNPFMERNAVAQVGAAVNGYYGLGANYKVYGRNWHIGASVAGDQIDNEGNENDSVTYSVRGHLNPIKTGTGFVHLGSWYYYEELADDVTAINNVPRIGQNFNDNLRVSSSSLADPKRDEGYGFELGGVYRSVWSLAEWTERRIVAGIGPMGLNERVDRDAWSVSAGWLITGEKPGFSTRSGVWGTTRVLRPVTEGGIGAFEIAARADHYDFTDAPNGADARRTTVGVNWYLNNHARLMLNYVDWETDNKVGAFQGPDSGQSIGMRAQVLF
ncbi:OprO/OprP family phosphate-selective porin [Polycyclovorans algicola]|uniref:OprO/OprP family phosphate-selective porin n=1 Tax=Polycyclovorans algicola TaxID=616992 RepID=UPI0004A7801B|nr:porin [Polycyclovorans algicola]